MPKVRSDSLCGGETFGRLTVLDYSHTITKGTHAIRVMNCKCACGNTIKVRTPNLKSGNTLSCGCYKRDRTISYNRTQHPNIKILKD